MSKGTFEILRDGNSNALNVLVLSEHINATYYISFDIPLTQLHTNSKLNFAVASQSHVQSEGEGCWKKWHNEFNPHIIVMTRYGHKSGISILDYFQQNGIPVIYHIDDDLLELPMSLGKEICQRHGADDVVETRKYLLKNSDLIYASTQYLADLLQSRFPEQKIMYGIYAPYMGADITHIDCRKKNKVTVIGYMGSKGHQQDLELVVPALDDLLEENIDLEFEVFGTIKIPERLLRFGKRVRSYPVKKSYIDFLSTLAGLEWDIGLAPLVNNPFNLCKAPTKYIEYTACAIPVIASNVPVYSKIIPEGGGFLTTDDNWRRSILQLLSNQSLRKDTVKTAQGYCSEVFSMQILQGQLMNIFSTVQPLETKNTC